MSQTKMQDEVMRAYNLVWAYRGRLQARWLTPNQDDTMRFALTEIAEAEDAYLRGKPEYRRNHHKEVTVEQELGQCAMMLLTALGPKLLTALGPEMDWTEWLVLPWSYWETSYDVAVTKGFRGTRSDWIVNWVNEALHQILWDDRFNLIYSSLHALVQIGLEVESRGGLVTVVEAEMQRVEATHGREGIGRSLAVPGVEGESDAPRGNTDKLGD